MAAAATRRLLRASSLLATAVVIPNDSASCRHVREWFQAQGHHSIPEQKRATWNDYSSQSGTYPCNCAQRLGHVYTLLGPKEMKALLKHSLTCLQFASETTVM